MDRSVVAFHVWWGGRAFRILDARERDNQAASPRKEGRNMNGKCFHSPIDSAHPTWGNLTRNLVRLIGVWVFLAVLLAHSVLFAPEIPIRIIDYYGLRTISQETVS